MSLRVQLLRAWPHRHEAMEMQLDDGATVGDALAAAGWALDAVHVGVAVFGVRATAHQTLVDGDRIELLRALALDPKQARRLRAQRARERAAR